MLRLKFIPYVVRQGVRHRTRTLLTLSRELAAVRSALMGFASVVWDFPLGRRATRPR